MRGRSTGTQKDLLHLYLLQVYIRFNHINVCLSYNATLTLIQDISKDHTLPLHRWITDDIISNFGVMWIKEKCS